MVKAPQAPREGTQPGASTPSTHPQIALAGSRGHGIFTNHISSLYVFLEATQMLNGYTNNLIQICLYRMVNLQHIILSFSKKWKDHSMKTFLKKCFKDCQRIPKIVLKIY